MRVNQYWAQRARELVNEVFPSDVLRAAADHPLMPRELAAAIAGIDADPEAEEEYVLSAVRAALAGAAAVPLMSADNSRQQGVPATFMSEVNMIRSGFVSADLTNFDAYQQIFPEVQERFGPDDGAIVLEGLRSRVAGMFASTDTAGATVRAVIHLVIDRSAAFEGQVPGQALAVANDGEITAEHVLNAADAIAHVTAASGVAFARGADALLRGLCEFVGGQGALQQYVAEVYPRASGPERAAVADRVQAYMSHFNGELVNALIRDVGSEWLATEAADYLAAYQQERLEYENADDEPDYGVEAEDEEPLLLGQDDFTFRM